MVHIKTLFIENSSNIFFEEKVKEIIPEVFMQQLLNLQILRENINSDVWNTTKILSIHFTHFLYFLLRKYVLPQYEY